MSVTIRSVEAVIQCDKCGRSSGAYEAFLPPIRSLSDIFASLDDSKDGGTEVTPGGGAICGTCLTNERKKEVNS